ncbi:MAG TPA: nicotinate phosphoribosyltransferase [Cyclobacteriaceae bacterium]|nr:nicotinate phosphoribosyltransferase [Cyclobacteriaceae bacterium]
MPLHSALSASYTDLYQITMGQVYFLSKRHHEKAVFDYFFRKLPFDGGYAIFAGLDDLLKIITTLRFTDEDLEFLTRSRFDAAFVDFLRDWRFRGTLYASSEGDVVFPTRPVLRVEGNILETQLIETLLLNILNFQTLVATKASRVRLAAGNAVLMDFGLRRAQGIGGYHATRASIVGGFNSTSNVYAAIDYEVPATGTMAHSFIQSYESELAAFRSFAEGRPEDCVLLVDTYNTLESGVPNAITVAREMEARGQRLLAIRLDSGDLAYLAKRSRRMLDEAGLQYVKISASNQLDEYVVKSLLDQEAPIDIFGVGTSLVTGKPDAALDGVYKLSFYRDKPRIKLSESLSKTTLPGAKQVYRAVDTRGDFAGADVVALADERNIDMMIHPFEAGKSMSLKGFRLEPQLQKVMENGEPTNESLSLTEIAEFSAGRLARLPAEYKRFHFPHLYKVGISKGLTKLREELRNDLKQTIP